MLPLDHPTPERAHRVYFALTNACNRDCPWCSTCSSTRGSTYMSLETFLAAFPREGAFQAQLEGGEPTVHPDFLRFVDAARAEPRCERVVVCTNGVRMPRGSGRLRPWLERLGAPLTLKLSLNHHLLDADAGLVQLAVAARDALGELGGDHLFVLNVRLRRGHDEDDARVRDAVERAGLLPHANVFFLQRYGFASGEASWDPPRPVWDRFTLVNPDGTIFGPESRPALRGDARAAMSARLVADWRRRKSAAFDLEGNSTARRTVELDLWGRRTEIYANANLSVYSAQTCNARCAFCVEELRPASRGTSLDAQRPAAAGDVAYFEALGSVLDALSPLSPSVSVTGGEPSKDPRLPRVLRMLEERGARKRTLTTNGSGLLDEREGRAVIDWIAATGVAHLNISRAHPDQGRNARLMRYFEGPDVAAMREIVRRARAGGTRVRLSCVLVRGAIEDLAGVLAYLDFARSLGVDNVIFRQLMQVDPETVLPNPVTRFSDARRAPLEPVLDRISEDGRFTLVRQIVGYYYYVEVYRHGEMDVVFEEADLAQLEREKRRRPDVIHELVFHPSGRLASTWQPWDGVLGPP